LFQFTGHTREYRRLVDDYQVQLQKTPEEADWLLLRGLMVGDPADAAIDVNANADLAHYWLWQRQFGTPTMADGSESPDQRRKRDYLGRLRPPDNSPLSVCQFITGLAELRAGALESAVELLLEAGADPHWPARYIVNAPLALAYHQQGELELAQQALNRSSQALEEQLKRLENQNEPVLSPWFDLVEALVLHEEASQKVSSKPSSLRFQVDQIRQASLALIERQ
jgi:hypothetical protein